MPAPGGYPHGATPSKNIHQHVQQRIQQQHIEALRQFLVSKGYHVPISGNNMGPVLKSALKDWHSGVGQRDPQAWDKANNRTALSELPKSERHTAKLEQSQVHVNFAPHNKPGGPAGGPHPKPSGPAPHLGRGNGGRGAGGATDFTAMLTQLLGHSGTAHMLPTALADQLAGADDAQAATIKDQLDHLPAAKKAALKNISDWYGQVQSSEKTASGRDASIAGAGQKSVADAAQGIMASLGGAASPAAGQIGSVGANDASTLAAMGANDKMLSSDLAPIFALAEAGAKTSRSNQYDQAQSDLQDSLGQAQGQGKADRANALMQILQANNSSRQSNFQNRAGLLNTLASLQVSGMNAQSEAQSRAIENALRVSEINKNGQKSQGGLDAMTPSQRAGLANALNGLLIDPSTSKLKSGLAWPNALQDIRNYLRTQGLNPLNKQVVNQLVAPTLANAGIQFQNPQTIYRP